MIEVRDIVLGEQKILATKQDETGYVRIVITDAAGNQSGAGNIWFDKTSRLVWYMPLGGTRPSWIRCIQVGEPEIGLAALAGYMPGSVELEVLRADDPFLARTGTNTYQTSYSSPATADFERGGRLQLWLAAELFTPLAVWPTFGTLNVNVNPGWYTRADNITTYYAGATDRNLTAYRPSTPGEYRYVGAYLDTSGILQFIAGTAVSVGDPPEPSWPSNVTRLAVVKLTEGQTAITFKDHVFNRRVFYSLGGAISARKNSGSVIGYRPRLNFIEGTNITLTVADDATDNELDITLNALATGWPLAGKVMINNTEYDSVQLAINAMAAGDIIKVGQGTDTGGIVPDTAGAIVGLSPAETIITRSDNSSITVSIDTPDNVTLKNLTIDNTGAGTSVACIQTNQDGITLDNLIIKKDSGAPTNSTGVSVYGGSGNGTYLKHCKIAITIGTNKYGVYTSSTTASNLIIEGGEINASTADIYIGHASSVVELRGVKLLGGGINNAGGGTVKGWYVDTYGDKIIVGASDIKGVGSNFPDLGTTTAAEKWGAIYQGPAKDSFPDDDRRGIATRFIHPAGYDDHFRSGSIPTSYAWKPNSGQFSGTPTILSYNHAGEYMQALSPVSGTAKHFLARAITNSAAAWQGQSLFARVKPTNSGSIGIRVDNGNAAVGQPYFEVYLTDNSNGTMTIYSATEAGVTTGATIPNRYLNLQIYCSYSGGIYTLSGYVEGEDGIFPSISTSGIVGWIPAAGGAGVFLKGNNNWQGADLIRNTFG